MAFERHIISMGIPDYYRESADLYDEYQLQEYENNRDKYIDGWRIHEAHHGAAIHNTLLDEFVNQKDQPRLEDLNLAVVGPGFKPVGREFHELYTVRPMLAKCRSIVLIDFSRKVIQSAMKSLTDAGVPEHKIYGAEIDATNGLSTAYLHFIQREILPIQQELQFHEKIEELAGTFSIKQLIEQRNREIDAYLAVMDPEVRAAMQAVIAPQFERSGTVPQGGGMKIMIDEKEHPIDLFSIQMVLAGTGAAAEACIWEQFQELQTNERFGALPAGKETNKKRRGVYRNIHRIINAYNTAVASMFIIETLEDNKNSKVLAITDENTMYEEPISRTYLRLSREELERQLVQAGITVGFPSDGSWNWKDQEHQHGVMVLKAERDQSEPATNGNGAHL